MYSWLVYIHVLATFAFLITHGVSSVVSLRLRPQRDPPQSRAWRELYASPGVNKVLYGSLLVLLLSDIIAAMFLIGSKYYTPLRKALGSSGLTAGRFSRPLIRLRPRRSRIS